ncbi:MAG: glycosyltransferase [Pseudobutyrivibrio sp.]|nr:glycosyltransferase [Pseudobutyrivibrio sp.]
MADKKHLLLITDGFPYGESERTFISKEFEILSGHFEVITLALTDLEEVKHNDPDPGKYYRLSWGKKELISALPSLASAEFRAEIKRAWTEDKHTNKLRRHLILKYHLVASYYEKYIQQLVKEHKIDIIYSYWCTPATIAAVRLYGARKGEEGVPKLVSRFHGYDLYRERAYGAMWQPFRASVTAGLDRFLFVSEFGRDYYLKTWPETDREKCLVSYIGTGEHKRIISDRNVFASCSVCYELKRIDRIIDALSLLPEKYKVKWVHVGAGGLFEDLKAQAEEKLGNKPNVEFVFEGFMDNSKLQETYEKHQAGAFITTSSTEGLPITIVEAQSMGLPVIATDVGGIKELVIDHETDAEHATGILLSSEPEIEEIAQAIMEFCDYSYGTKRSMSDNSRTRWGLYHYDAQNATKLAKVFEEL